MSVRDDDVLIWWVVENDVMHPCSDLSGALWLVAVVRTWCEDARIFCEVAEPAIRGLAAR